MRSYPTLNEVIPGIDSKELAHQINECLNAASGKTEYMVKEIEDYIHSLSFISKFDKNSRNNMNQASLSVLNFIIHVFKDNDTVYIKSANMDDWFTKIKIA